MSRDAFDVHISTSGAAARAFDDAAAMIRLYQGDPIAALDQALDLDQDFALAWAVRGAVLAQQTDRSLLEEAHRSIRAGKSVAKRATAREQDHLAAAEAWAQGRFFDATALWGRIAQEHPRDLLALQFAHLGDFYLGQQSELRDRPLQALRAWSADEPARHAILGMAAFGLEECGDYERAEDLGREAVDLEPRDGWAVHAVTHVCEMQGRASDGRQWLLAGADSWAPDSGFAFHNWWHLALFHLDQQDVAGALSIYNEKVRPAPSDVILEMVDASALLWRLWLGGADVRVQFSELADSWLAKSAQSHYAFNEAHAVMAFVAAGRFGDAQRVINALESDSRGDDDNAVITRQVGLPVARALFDFGYGRYDAAADALHAVRGRAQRFGGSHAQRDIISLTLFEAALRAGRRPLAEAMAAERLSHKPESPWARALSKRTYDVARRGAA